MNLQFNAIHGQVVALLRQLDIRFLVDDQYDQLNPNFLQIWLPQPHTETEVKLIAKFYKAHYALWKEKDGIWAQVKHQLGLDGAFETNYNERKATLVKISLVERLTFEQAWFKRLGFVCDDHDLDFIADRYQGESPVDELGQAIGDSFSSEWINTVAALELFQVRYLIYNKAPRNDETKIGQPGLLHIWTDPEGDNPKQARKANARVTGNPGGISHYQKGHPTIVQGRCVWVADRRTFEFDDCYRRRIRVNVEGVLVPMMHPSDRT